MLSNLPKWAKVLIVAGTLLLITLALPCPGMPAEAIVPWMC